MKHSFYSKALALMACIAIINGARIKEIQCKTADEAYAGMDGGSKILINIWDICSTGFNLDSVHNDFMRGGIDSFYGAQIGGCDGAELDNDDTAATRMAVHHSGSDAWKGDWVRIIMEGGVYRQCALGKEIDDGQAELIYCYPYGVEN